MLMKVRVQQHAPTGKAVGISAACMPTHALLDFLQLESHIWQGSAIPPKERYKHPLDHDF